MTQLNTLSRLLFLVVSCATLVLGGCDRPIARLPSRTDVNIHVQLPTLLRGVDLGDDRALSVTVEVPGQLAETAVALDGNGGTATVTFVEVEAGRSFDYVVRAKGGVGLEADILLARLGGTLTLEGDGTIDLDVDLDEALSSPEDSPAFDLNGNDRSNLVDFAAGCDPAEQAPFVQVSTPALEFLGTEDGQKRILIARNTSDDPDSRVSLSLQVLDAPGAALSPLPEGLQSLTSTRTLGVDAPIELPFGDQNITTVHFSPSSAEFASGAVLLQAVEERLDDDGNVVCRSQQNLQVPVFGNLEGALPAVPDDAETPAPLEGDVSILGIPADAIVDVPLENLHHGQPLAGTLADVAGPVVDGFVVDAVYRADVPADARFDVLLADMEADLDLLVVELDVASAATQELSRHRVAGLLPEGASIAPARSRRTLLVVVGRKDPTAPTLTAPRFQLSMRLLAGPVVEGRPTPAFAPAEGGTRVTLSGARLSDDAVVYVGPFRALDVDASDDGSSLQFTTPALPADGQPLDLIVDQAGVRAVLPDAFFVEPIAPSLASLAPTVVSPGGLLTVLGDGFSDAFGPVEVRLGSVVAVVDEATPTTLVVQAPQLADGDYDLSVSVARPFSGAPATTVFPAPVTVVPPLGPTPEVNAIAPTTASTSGGTLIEVTGSDFSDGAVVRFGTLTAAQTVFVDAQHLTAVAPPHAEGVVEVRVQNVDGQTSPSALLLTYVDTGDTAPPTLFTASPTVLHAGVPGDVVRLVGAALNQTTVTQVVFDDGEGDKAGTLVAPASANVLQVRVDEALAESDEVIAHVSFASGITVSSPVLQSRPPTIAQVTSTAALIDDGATKLVVQGAQLFPAALTAAGVVQNATFVPLVVEVELESYLQLDVPAGVLDQGPLGVELHYGDVVVQAEPLDVAGNCGNAEVNLGEDCDGAHLAAASCSTLGFAGGTLRCDDSCRFDTALCDTCGNGVRDTGESCDGLDVGATCADLTAYDDGVLACHTDCSFDVSGCSRCGNGIREGNEACDGVDVGVSLCSDFGLPGDGIACTNDCTLDLSECTSCGDGICSEGELADGACAVDCDACGDGTCDAMAGETCSSCATDCNACAPYTLSLDETPGRTPVYRDAPGTLRVRVVDESNQPVVGVGISLELPADVWALPAAGPTNDVGEFHAVLRSGHVEGPRSITVHAVAPDGAAVQGAPTTFDLDVDPIEAGTINNYVNNTGTTTYYAGSDDSHASRFALNNPRATVHASDGTMYVVESHAIVRVDPDGKAERLTDSYGAGFAGDGGPLSGALFRSPYDLALLDDGDLLIVDTNNHRLRRVDAGADQRVDRDDIITSVVGGGDQLVTGTGSTYDLQYPYAVEPLPNGNVVLWSYSRCDLAEYNPVTDVVQRLNRNTSCSCSSGLDGLDVSGVDAGMEVTAQGDILVTGNSCGTGARSLMRFDPAVSAFRVVMQSASNRTIDSVVQDGADNLLLGVGQEVVLVEPHGSWTTLGGAYGRTVGGDEGPIADAGLGAPLGLEVHNGLLYIAGYASHSIRVMQWAPAPRSTYALTDVTAVDHTGWPSMPTASPPQVQLQRDGTPLSNVDVHFDSTNAVRIAPSTSLTGSSGDGTALSIVEMPLDGDAVVTASANDIYGRPLAPSVDITFTSVRPPDGTFVSVVNRQESATQSNATHYPQTMHGLLPTSSGSNGLGSMALDVNGDLYFANQGQHRLERVTSDGWATIFAGSGAGASGFSGDYGPADAALLSHPGSLEIHGNHLYFADTNNHRVRRVDLSPPHHIDTVAGGGPTGQTDDGDGNLALAAYVGAPRTLTFDDNGGMFILSTSRVRYVRPDGIIITALEAGDSCFGDGPLYDLSYGIALDQDGASVLVGGRVYSYAGCTLPGGFGVFRLTPTTMLPTGPADFTYAHVGAIDNHISDIALDDNGDLYVSSNYDYALWRINASDGSTDVVATNSIPWARSGTVPDMRLYAPTGLLLDGDDLLVHTSSGHIFKLFGITAP